MELPDRLPRTRVECVTQTAQLMFDSFAYELVPSTIAKEPDSGTRIRLTNRFAKRFRATAASGFINFNEVKFRMRCIAALRQEEAANA